VLIYAIVFKPAHLGLLLYEAEQKEETTNPIEEIMPYLW
jgi:hypothetical protein